MADTSVTRLGFLGRQRAPDADRYRALRGAASNPFCKITTAQPAVFVLTERLFLEGAGAQRRLSADGRFGAWFGSQIRRPLPQTRQT